MIMIFYPVLLVPAFQERQAAPLSVGLVILSQWRHIPLTHLADITAIRRTYKDNL